MATSVSSMALLPNAKILSINSSKTPCESTAGFIRLRFSPSQQAASKSSKKESSAQNFLLKGAVAVAILSSLCSCNSALAAKQIAEAAEKDNRGLAILLPLFPAIAWALYNILGPAINQVRRMRSQ